MAKKEVATTNTNTALADTRPDYMKDTERGSENVGRDDLTIPRIGLIQDLSPQHKKNKPEYIEGAEPGLLFNTVTNKLYGSSLLFVPVTYIKEYIIWKDQAAGGGFCGAFASLKEAEEEFDKQGYGGETVKVNGVEKPAYEIVDTAQHYGMIINEDGSVEEVVSSMSKSMMKVSRKLNSMVKLAGGDRFSRAYRIDAVEDQNSAGQDYWNINVTQLGFVSENVYKQGEKMYESISSGTRAVNYGDNAATSEAKEEAEREY